MRIARFCGSGDMVPWGKRGEGVWSQGRHPGLGGRGGMAFLIALLEMTFFPLLIYNKQRIPGRPPQTRQSADDELKLYLG